MTYTLAEIRYGTGWPKDVRFQVVEAADKKLYSVSWQWVDDDDFGDYLNFVYLTQKEAEQLQARLDRLESEDDIRRGCVSCIEECMTSLADVFVTVKEREELHDLR